MQAIEKEDRSLKSIGYQSLENFTAVGPWDILQEENIFIS